MKILIDMNPSPSWVPFLAGHGFEAVHGASVGSPSAADSQILAYADANAFVIFTHDLDFGTLLAARQTRGPSVLQVRTQDVLPEAIGDTVVRALDTARSHLEAGALVTVDRIRSRIRVLPL
jgi:predicted nuclease of predicted toxin-antitoxin system